LSSQRILVCQNRTCRKQGAKTVLAEFQAQNIAEVKIFGSGCLGQCGNGPMVLILPAEIWCDRVSVEEVTAILTRYALTSDRATPTTPLTSPQSP
jgi:(2Fe-2S) ferredoxin